METRGTWLPAFDASNSNPRRPLVDLQVFLDLADELEKESDGLDRAALKALNPVVLGTYSGSCSAHRAIAQRIRKIVGEYKSRQLEGMESDLAELSEAIFSGGRAFLIPKIKAYNRLKCQILRMHGHKVVEFRTFPDGNNYSRRSEDGPWERCPDVVQGNMLDFCVVDDPFIEKEEADEGSRSAT